MCGCLFDKSGLSRQREQLNSTEEFLSTLRNDNGLKISEEDREVVYKREVDHYLLHLSKLPEFYNANLESRVWVSKYFDELQNVRIIIK